MFSSQLIEIKQHLISNLRLHGTISLAKPFVLLCDREKHFIHYFILQILS